MLKIALPDLSDFEVCDFNFFVCFHCENYYENSSSSNETFGLHETMQIM